MNHALLAIFGLLLAPEGADRYAVSAGPAAEDLRFTLLSVELPDAPGVSAAALKTAEGKTVPAQVERSGGKLRVSWMVEELKKGATAEWTLTLEKAAGSPRIAVKREEGGAVAIEAPTGLDGHRSLFTTLVADPDEYKPYLYPLFLDGVRVTRHFPMEEYPDEDRDHPHQRSFWFTHGDVQGTDFWSEGPKAGKIRQREIRAAEGGGVFARIATSNEWLTPAGKKLLDDERELRFYDLGTAGRMIDFTSILKAADEPVTFGDTKEGSFGIRLAESMKEKRGGRIENSRSQVGMKDAWGKPAEWVDYVGTVEGRKVGVAILDHPSSFRHPTTWHVRDYGLFAANPFGLRDFTGDKSKDGGHRLEKGQTMQFRYRVFLHPGDTAGAGLPAVWNGWAKPPEVKLKPMP